MYPCLVSLRQNTFKTNNKQITSKQRNKLPLIKQGCNSDFQTLNFPKEFKRRRACYNYRQFYISIHVIHYQLSWFPSVAISICLKKSFSNFFQRILTRQVLTLFSLRSLDFMHIVEDYFSLICFQFDISSPRLINVIYFFLFCPFGF